MLPARLESGVGWRNQVISARIPVGRMSFNSKKQTFGPAQFGNWSLQCLFSIPNGPGIEQELRPKPGWRGLGINPFQATDVAHGLKCRPTDPPATITSIYFLKSVCLSVCLCHTAAATRRETNRKINERNQKKIHLCSGQSSHECSESIRDVRMQRSPSLHGAPALRVSKVVCAVD